MRAVVQRTLSASVTVDGEVSGSTERPELLVYLGVTHDDGPDDIAWTARKGRRPTWNAAAPGSVSEPAYDAFCAGLERLGAEVARGRFGAELQVASVNDGPVTTVLDSTR